MIAERPGGKIKHDCDLWIPEPGFCFPLGPLIRPRSFQGTSRGDVPVGLAWRDRENHRAHGSPGLQTVREYGRFSSIIKEF